MSRIIAHCSSAERVVFASFAIHLQNSSPLTPISLRNALLATLLSPSLRHAVATGQTAWVGSLRTEANTVYASNADVLESFTSSTVDELAEKRLLSSVR